MSLSAGDKLGPYEILAPIGAGGMGEVYKAHDARLERIVAIKQFKHGHKARFQQEARLIAALNHPHICQVFDVGSDYLVMEYIDGRMASGPLRVDNAVKLALEIASAIEAAHGKGILHRDLKPANILVTAEGAAKILDFGLAKLMTESNTDATMTTEGTILGTPAYMAPEQAEGKALDARSDIFSFGSVFYEMLSGCRAFPGNSTAQALSAVLRDEPAPLAVSAELQKIIRKCLAKRPEDRFANMAELRRALEQAASPSGAVSKGGSEPEVGEQGFWIAVIPFKVSGAGADLPALAEGLTEDIVAGLSRFSYLRVLTKESAGIARYVIEGSLRQTGSQLRLAVQLADTASGTRLWAETYNRSYSPDAIFDIQDSLVPPIVATVAEWNGVLTYNMWMVLRDRDPRTFTPYEALLRSAGFGQLPTPDEYQLALTILTRATEEDPNHSGCLEMLGHVHAYGYLFSFGGHDSGHDAGNDSRDASLYYARRAVAADSSNHRALYTLALAHSCRKEIAAFRAAGERAIALNPLDGQVMAHIGMWIAYSGDWERGCDLVKSAMKLNARHPGWYWYPLAHDAYRRNDIVQALEYALRLNTPGLFWTHELLARIYARLGNRAAASQALQDLIALRPDFPATARREFERFFVETSFIDEMLDGLRLAGLKIAGEESAAADGPKSSPDAAPSPSIAVLPFVNLSGDKEQEYFSDGLAEEILNALAKVPGLRVIARASAFAFRNRENAVAEIGEKLRVTSILHGAVRRSGSRIRVTAQLINVSDETQLWAERYDREMLDVFDIQDEIAQAIVAQLKVKLSVKAGTPLVKRYTENMEAHSLYLRGVFHVHRLRNEEMERGREYLEKAVALDPLYAPALFELGGYYVAMGHRGGVLPLDQWPKVRQLAAKALEADPEFAEAHAALGLMSAFCDFRWEDAIRALDGALELNPASALAHFWRSNVLFILGRGEAALIAIGRAVELDPLLALFHTYGALYSLLLGRPEQAIESARRSLEVDPEFPVAMLLMGEACSLLGRHEEGAALIEKTLAGVPPGYFYSALLAWVYVRSGRQQDAERLRATLEETAKVQYVPAGTRAFVAAALEDPESALTLLEEAVRERDPNIPLWIGSQYFQALHGSPRFDQLLRSMNLRRSVAPAGRAATDAALSL